MSLRYRIQRIEAAIPFEDVVMAWRTKREHWIESVSKASSSAKLLAARLLELLEALTPGSIAYFWPDTSAFARLCERLRPLARGVTPDPHAHLLEPIVEYVEKSTIPPPPAAEQRLMGKGKPLVLPLGDDGPQLHAGDRCFVLDIRMIWCKASVVGVRNAPVSCGTPGGVQYRVHYDGWKARWDEWVDVESGRVSSVLPDGAKASKATATSSARSAAPKPRTNESKPRAKQSSAKLRGRGLARASDSNADEGDAEDTPPVTRLRDRRGVPGNDAKPQSAKGATDGKEGARRQGASKDRASAPKGKPEASAKVAAGAELEDDNASSATSAANEGATPGWKGASALAAPRRTGKTKASLERVERLHRMRTRLKKTIAKKRGASGLAAAPAAGGEGAGRATASGGELPPAPAGTVVVQSGDTVAAGEAVFALDVREEWCTARVVEVWYKRGTKVLNAVKVRFSGWNSRWDEYIPLHTKKLRRLVKPSSNAMRAAAVEEKHDPASVAERAAAARGRKAAKARTQGVAAARAAPLKRKRGAADEGGSSAEASEKAVEASERAAEASGKAAEASGKEAEPSGTAAAAKASDAAAEESDSIEGLLLVRLRLRGMIRSSYGTRPVVTPPVRLGDDIIPDYPPRTRKKPVAKSASLAPTKPAAPLVEGETAHRGISLRVGDFCYGLDRRAVWCRAKVIEIEGLRVKLQYCTPVDGQLAEEWKTLRPTQVRLTPPAEMNSAATAATAAPPPACAATAAPTAATTATPSVTTVAVRIPPAAAPRVSPKLAPTFPPAAEQSLRPAAEASVREAPLPSPFGDVAALGGQLDVEDRFAMLHESERSPVPPLCSANLVEVEAQPLSPLSSVDKEEAGILIESEVPITSSRLPPHPAIPVAMPYAPPLVPMLTDLPELRLRGYLQELQLTRDLLRTMQQQPRLLLERQGYFVRLNMGMKTRQYTAAQVVESALDTLQVRGVDRDLLGKTQLTKLAYVSNAPFQSEEVSDLIFRLRKEHVLVRTLDSMSRGGEACRELTARASRSQNLPVAKVLQMIEMKKRIQEDPLYKYVRHQVHGSHSSEAITAQALPVATATSVQHAVQAVHPLAGGMMRAIPALDPYLPSYGAARLRQGWTPPTMGHFQPARPHVMPVHAQALQTRENEALMPVSSAPPFASISSSEA